MFALSITLWKIGTFYMLRLYFSLEVMMIDSMNYSMLKVKEKPQSSNYDSDTLNLFDKKIPQNEPNPTQFHNIMILLQNDKKRILDFSHETSIYYLE